MNGAPTGRPSIPLMAGIMAPQHGRARRGPVGRHPQTDRAPCLKYERKIAVAEKTEYFGRISCETDAVRPLLASDFALGSGWGNTASVAVQTGSHEGAFTITITSAGTGQGASPDCTLTWPGGPWTQRTGATRWPHSVATVAGGAQLTVPWAVVSDSDVCLMVWGGTPVADETFSVTVLTMG